MTFLTIVERELRVASRRKSTWRIRIGIASVAAVISVMFLLFAPVFRRGLSGSTLFFMLSVYAFIIALMAGVFVTSDSLSEEKREGTLGLLFLTGLRPIDIVLGKFAAMSLNALFGLLALVPILGVPLLFGGVTGGELWRMALVLFSTMFCSLSVGIFISALNRNAQASMSYTFMAMLVLTLGLSLGNLGARWAYFSSNWTWTFFASPLHAFTTCWETPYLMQPARFWHSLSGLVLHGLFWLALTARVLPHVWKDHPAHGVSEAAVEVPAHAGDSPRAPRKRRRPALLDANPVLWLSSGHGAEQAIIWSIMAVNLTWFLWVATSGGEAEWIVFPARLTAGGLKILFTLQACRFFVEARQNGALEMLLSTPLTDADIIRSQWQGLRKAFFWPWFIIGVECVYALIATPSRSFVLFFPFSALPVVLNLVFDPLAIGWFGMWLALTSKRPGWTAGRTMLFLVVLPPLFFCVPDFIIDLLVIAWARQRLDGKVRALALQPSTSEIVMPAGASATRMPPVMRAR